MQAFEKSTMTTLSSCVNVLQHEGYKENFVVKEEGLEAPSTGKIYKHDEVTIANFFRFEGESDPADNSILYAIETNDGVKGMLIDAYGESADPGVSVFIRTVENISKKKHNSV